MQINIDVNIDVTIVYNNLVVLNVKVNLKPPSLTNNRVGMKDLALTRSRRNVQMFSSGSGYRI
jgi:hypothetical protein